MPGNLIEETELPGTRVTSTQLQMICNRYYQASQFVNGKWVLEVGCGPGLGLGYMARKASKVVGGDYTAESIRYAQKHYQGSVDLVRLDAQKLPFHKGCFDVVVSVEVMFYIPHADLFIAECRRVLRNEGILFLGLPNQDVPGFHKSPLSSRYFSAPELATLLSQHFDTKLFGAFPISRPGWHSLQSAARLTIGKTLNLAPKGKWLKETLRRVLFGRNLVLAEEVEDGMAETMPWEPISASSPDLRHQFLFAIAQVK